MYYTIGFSDGSTESFQFVLDAPVCLYYKKPIASLTVYVGFDDSQVSQDDKLFIEMRELSYKFRMRISMEAYTLMITYLVK